MYTFRPRLPKLDYAFTANWEMTVNNEHSFEGFPNKITSYGTMYYDYDHDAAHGIWRIMDGYYENAFHQLELLHDEHEDGERWTWLGDGVGATPIELTMILKNAISQQ